MDVSTHADTAGLSPIPASQLQRTLSFKTALCKRSFGDWAAPSQENQNKGCNTNTNMSAGSPQPSGHARNSTHGSFVLSRSFSNVHLRAELAHKEKENEADPEEESDVGLKLDVAIAHSQVHLTYLFVEIYTCTRLCVCNHSHLQVQCRYLVERFELPHPCPLLVLCARACVYKNAFQLYESAQLHGLGEETCRCHI